MTHRQSVGKARPPGDTVAIVDDGEDTGVVPETGRGLRYTYLAMLPFHAIALAWTGGYSHGNDPYMMIAGSVTILVYGIVVFVFLIGFFGVRQGEIFTSTRSPADAGEQRKKYTKSGLTEEASGKLHQTLVQVPPQDIQVVATGDHHTKLHYLLEHGIRYFVEDRLETCEQLAGHGITPILFAQPWNRRPHPFLEVSDWPQLASLLFEK